MMPDETPDYGRSEKDVTPAGWASYWSKELAAFKKWSQQWHSIGNTIETEFLGRTDDSARQLGKESKYNIFWANVQVLLAAVYAKLPAPEVDRAHLDQNDDVARVAALILERIFVFEAKNLDESPDNVYREAIKDRFVSGMGQVWPRYEFKTEDVTTPAILDPETQQELAPAVTQSIVTHEAVPLDYVRWEDFVFSPTRIWETRRWVGRRVYMSKDACLARFGAIIGKDISYKTNFKIQNRDDPLKLMPEPMAEVYELWSLEHKAVFWYNPGSSVILDVKADPLKLSGFFPVKKPLIATTVSAAFLPRPDYTMVQDQYEELNILSTRMHLLTEALRVVGVYDSTAESIKSLLNNGMFNRMLPVDNWAMFAEKGGIRGAVDWFPIDVVVQALEKMTMRKKGLLQEIYEILGLSDIMRGQSVASETATAQQLKAQYGSARMQRVQVEVAEFVTANIRTRAEIICKHWSPETIIQRSQAMQLPQQDQAYLQPAIALLKNSNDMALRLTIQADSLAAPDWQQEKQERIDFLQAMSQFIGQSMPLIDKEPGAGPFLLQMLQWAATGFKAGKQIEGILDGAVNAIMQARMRPKPPQPPSPQAIKDKASAMKLAAEADQINAETAVIMEPGVQAPPGEGGPGRPPSTALPMRRVQ
jgi:hypothetical protein